MENKRIKSFLKNPLFYGMLGVVIVIISKSNIPENQTKELVENLEKSLPLIESVGWVLVIVSTIVFFIRRWNKKINEL